MLEMKINIEGSPEEIAKLLQAIESSEEQLHANSFYLSDNESIDPTNIPSIEETLKAKSSR